MQINRCLVIVKQTALAQSGRAADFAKRGDATAKRLLHADVEHGRTAAEMRRVLKRFKIAFLEISLDKLNAALKRRYEILD